MLNLTLNYFVKNIRPNIESSVSIQHFLNDAESIVIPSPSRQSFDWPWIVALARFIYDPREKVPIYPTERERSSLAPSQDHHKWRRALLGVSPRVGYYVQLARVADGERTAGAAQGLPAV